MKRFAIVSQVFLHSCYRTSTPDRKGNTRETFADRWEYVGVAVDEPGYTI